MSSHDDLLEAWSWLESQLGRLRFGKVTVTVQIHAAKVTKVFRTIEESLPSPAAENGASNGRSR